MSGLSAEDKAALWNIGVDFRESVETVEQIVRRHVTAALNEAADAIEAEMLTDATGHPEDLAYERGLHDALRAVRDLANP